MFKFLIGLIVGFFLFISHAAAAGYGAYIVDMGWKASTSAKKKNDNPVDLS